MSQSLHDTLYASAEAAVNRLFGDTSVSQAVTRSSLATLRDEIDNLLDTLDDENE